MKYDFKTKPFQHQLETFEATKDRPWYAIFWEQGTGKSKLTLDTAGHLYCEGKVDTLFVIAPNGVHRNWTAEEVHAHWNDNLLDRTETFTYHSSKAKTKKSQVAAERAMAHKGLSVVAMSYDAFRTPAGKTFAKQLLTRRRCFYVLDESARIKSPQAQRTKLILASAKYATYKRILTGTPVAAGPFDIYTQMRFLDADYWKPRGLGNYTMFKNYFARWRQGEANGRKFPILVDYQNLDELHDIIKNDSSRVLKDDVLDLPPKLYSKRFFSMTAKQGKLYRALRDDFMAELDGSTVNAALAITRLMRLQQIACGYVTVDREVPAVFGLDVQKEIVDIDDKNERLATLLEVVEDLPHKAIIWARFRRDIDLICQALGDRAVRFDGDTTVEEKAHAVDSFQKGELGKSPQFFVANAQAAGEGLTLTAAKTVIYYNNTFKLSERLQSEDRAHRISQDRPVQYIDIVAEHTVDSHIIQALRDHLDISNQITGDRVKAWL